MNIYRVCMLNEIDSKIEAGINIPGGKFGYTGFWTTNIECAKKIKADRDHVCEWEINGGSSWATIIQTSLDNVITIPNFKKYKFGQDDEYDNGELFVKSIKNIELIKILKG
ncbi:hypothetical protein [Clostridium perfringens]|uniref:hypothetical protein n=1 Tax=Clostridium perfringens TaxID=1502 RepID=UPI003F438197